MHFRLSLPYYLPKMTRKNQNLEKMKKTPTDITILHVYQIL